MSPYNEDIAALDRGERIVREVASETDVPYEAICLDWSERLLAARVLATRRLRKAGLSWMQVAIVLGYSCHTGPLHLLKLADRKKAKAKGAS